MFWRGMVGGILGAIGIGGVAASIVLAILYSGKPTGPTSEEVAATATAAFEEGRAAGQATEKAAAEKCDVVVGVQPVPGEKFTPNEKVRMELVIRSSKTGNQYTVTTPPTCSVNADGTKCAPPDPYSIGKPWPPACG